MLPYYGHVRRYQRRNKTDRSKHFHCHCQPIDGDADGSSDGEKGPQREGGGVSKRKERAFILKLLAINVCYFVSYYHIDNIMRRSNNDGWSCCAQYIALIKSKMEHFLLEPGMGNRGFPPSHYQRKCVSLFLASMHTPPAAKGPLYLVSSCLKNQKPTAMQYCCTTHQPPKTSTTFFRRRPRLFQSPNALASFQTKPLRT